MRRWSDPSCIQICMASAGGGPVVLSSLAANAERRPLTLKLCLQVQRMESR